MTLPRRIAAFLSVCVTVLPAAAQQPPPKLSDTVKVLLEKGALMKFDGGRTADMIYNPNGTLGGVVGALGGTWTAEGARVCVNVPGFAENECLTYPDGKKSGDTFDIPTKSTPVTISIN